MTLVRPTTPVWAVCGTNAAAEETRRATTAVFIVRLSLEIASKIQATHSCIQ